jgi:hypothetical protein
MAFGLDDAIGIGASIAGGLFGDDANDESAGRIGAANALSQKAIKDQQRANDKAFKPYMDVGLNSANKLSVLLGLGGTAGGGRNYAETPLGFEEYIDWAGFDRPGAERIRKGRGEWDETERANLERAYAAYLKGLKTVDATEDPEYNSLLRDFSSQDLEDDVVYNKGLQFGLDEGLKGLNRRAASGGAYDSGATLKALTRYANDYGTTKAEGAYNRFMNDKNTTYNFLSGQQNVGLSATGQNQSLNTGLLTSAANANMNAANLQAGYGVQGASALNNGIMSGIGNYLYSQRMGNGGGYGTPGINGAAGYPGYTYGSSSIPWYA